MSSQGQAQLSCPAGEEVLVWCSEEDGEEPEEGYNGAGTQRSVCTQLGEAWGQTRASEERAVVAVLVGTRGAIFGQDSLNPTVFLTGESESESRSVVSDSLQPH